MDFWNVFRDSIISIVPDNGSFNKKIKHKIIYTNNKFKKLKLKSNFLINEGIYPLLSLQINESDKEIINNPHTFYKFLFEVYFNGKSIFSYSPNSFIYPTHPSKADKGIWDMNKLLSKYHIPYMLNILENNKIYMYNRGVLVSK